ncbi:hypothetical protein MRX96_008354 [Rhipicephalus microplus]
MFLGNRVCHDRTSVVAGYDCSGPHFAVRSIKGLRNRRLRRMATRLAFYKLTTVPQTETLLAAGPGKEQRGSAGYFQQLFHAPNGNLFGVLSPLQQRSGRGCAMKPSFLCRQPAQQMGQRATRSRSGRRGGGSRCLKFHNFIPSESITSEKGRWLARRRVESAR